MPHLPMTAPASEQLLNSPESKSTPPQPNHKVEISAKSAACLAVLETKRIGPPHEPHIKVKQEAGAAWMQRVTNTYPATVWLNPIPEEQWGYSQSVRIMRELMNDRMYPLTLAGLDDAMRELSRKT